MDRSLNWRRIKEEEDLLVCELLDQISHQECSTGQYKAVNGSTDQYMAVQGSTDQYRAVQDSAG